LKLVLYSRQNCPLCDAFESELNDFIQSFATNIGKIEKQDVDSDESLKQQYGHDVPVLTLNNQLICQHFFDKDKILKVLG